MATPYTFSQSPDECTWYWPMLKHGMHFFEIYWHKSQRELDFDARYFAVEHFKKNGEIKLTVRSLKSSTQFKNLKRKIAKYFWFVQRYAVLFPGKTFSKNFDWISNKAFNDTMNYYKVNPIKEEVSKDEDITSGYSFFSTSFERDASVSTEVTEIYNEMYKENYENIDDFHGNSVSHQLLWSKNNCEMPGQPNFSDGPFSSEKILKKSKKSKKRNKRKRENSQNLDFYEIYCKNKKGIQLTIELNNKPRKCFGNLEFAIYYWFVQSFTAKIKHLVKLNSIESDKCFYNTGIKNIFEDKNKTYYGHLSMRLNDGGKVQDGVLVEPECVSFASCERDVSVSTEVTETQDEKLSNKKSYGNGFDIHGITASQQVLQSKEDCEIELSDRSIERKFEEGRAFMQSEENTTHVKGIESGESDTVRAFITSGEIEVKNFQPPSSSNNKDKQSQTRSLNDGGKNNYTDEVLSEAGIHPSSEEHINCSGTSTPLGLLDDVEADGSPSDRTGDPPGQQSIYIPPGDYRKETYRLSTFENFPVASPISRKDLAKNGFYFLGYLDRVKCFSCARSVEKWVITDSPSDRKWHKPTCPFMRGEPTGNTPILNLMGSLAALSGSTSGQEEVIQQRDPNTGQVIRTVRYPADLPERVRRSGGTFQIGPGNTVHVQGGNQQQNFNIGQNQEARTAGLLSTNISTQRAPPQHQPTNRTWTMANVISSDHRRFLTNLFLDRELDRITSFARWPTDRPNVPPAALAKSGFFYLGDMDRTQCFSCGGVLRNWSLQDQAAAQHRIHFTGCRMVTGTETRNIPIPDENETAGQLAVDYPLRFPQNPHMRGQAQREQTFDRRWPAGTIRVTPAQIAEAGFFYLGERDRVKCWYCNGGLQNWELDDIPWDEHSKWFPNCQFLLRTKGQRFVSRYLSPNANLARPIIARQDGSPLNPIGTPQIGSVRGQGQDIPPSVARQRSPTPPPTIIDPQEEMRKRKIRVQNILKNSEVVKNVLAMGFAETIVETLLIDRISANKEDNPNDIYGTVSELLDDVMKKEDEIRQEEEETRDQTQSIFSNPSAYSSMSGLSSIGAMAPGSGKYNVSYFDDEDMQDEDMYGSMEGASNRNDTKAKQFLSMETDPKSLQEQLTKLEDEQMCKICFTNKADMVFVPCSHMSCCMECTQAIKHCPVCRTRIERAMRTYSK